MMLFKFGIATEANDYQDITEDQIWIKGDSGQLILMEDNTNENDKE